MWYCVYCRSKQELRCGGAGHPPLIVFKPDGKLCRINSHNIMIGAETNYRFHYETIQIMKNSIIYLYTDGVFEIKLADGMRLKIDDFENLLYENLNNHTNGLDSLYNHMVNLNSGNTLDDDFTII